MRVVRLTRGRSGLDGARPAAKPRGNTTFARWAIWMPDRRHVGLLYIKALDHPEQSPVAQRQHHAHAALSGGLGRELAPAQPGLVRRPYAEGVEPRAPERQPVADEVQAHVPREPIGERRLVPSERGARVGRREHDDTVHHDEGERRRVGAEVVGQRGEGRRGEDPAGREEGEEDPLWTFAGLMELVERR
jgi:hypothetical protein